MNTKVNKFCVKAGTNGGTIKDIHKFQSVLTNYEITVYGDLSVKFI